MMMIRIWLLVWSTLLLLWRGLLAHLAVLNSGSPSPADALPIAEVTIARAFYGRLGAGASDYYSFEAAPGTPLRLSMLVPLQHYQAGFRPLITLSGSGLPPAGLTPPPSEAGMRRGDTIYQRTQRDMVTLAGGSYRIQISGAGAGVYCFCVGDREPPHYADAETRARIAALLAENS